MKDTGHVRIKYLHIIYIRLSFNILNAQKQPERTSQTQKEKRQRRWTSNSTLAIQMAEKQSKVLLVTQECKLKQWVTFFSTELAKMEKKKSSVGKGGGQWHSMEKFNLVLYLKANWQHLSTFNGKQACSQKV